MQRLLRACAALALLAPTALSLSPAPAHADALARIVKNGKLRVGMSANQPPLNFRSKSGTLMGLEVDLATALASLMEVKLEIVERPFGELLGALEKGDVDLVMSGMTITASRNLRAAFVGPYFLSGKSILTKSTSPLARATQTDDLDQADLTLAALAGSTSQRFVETLLPQAKLVATQNYDEAVKLLLGDRVQALVADYQIVELTAFLHPKENLTTLSRPLTIEPIGIAAPPGDALLLNFLENTLSALEAGGVLEALNERWLKQSDWVQELP